MKTLLYQQHPKRQTLAGTVLHWPGFAEISEASALMSATTFTQLT